MSKLEDILRERGRYSAGVERADAVLHGLTNNEARRQVKDLILDLIGEDEEPGRTMGPGMPSFQRDLLRRELRQKVEEL